MTLHQKLSSYYVVSLRSTTGTGSQGGKNTLKRGTSRGASETGGPAYRSEVNSNEGDKSRASDDSCLTPIIFYSPAEVRSETTGVLRKDETSFQQLVAENHLEHILEALKNDGEDVSIT